MQLPHSLKPPGFTTLEPIKCKPGFRTFAFKRNLHRYAAVGHEGHGRVAAYEDAGGSGGGGGDGGAEDARRRQAADSARAFNQDVDPWLKERLHSGEERDGSGVAMSSAEAYEMVRRVPLRRTEWNVGGWKTHDLAVAAAIGLSCALAVGAVLTPIVAPHVFDGTIQGGWGKSAAMLARERRERQQRTMAAELRNSRAGHVVVTGGDGAGAGGWSAGGVHYVEMGGAPPSADRNWFDKGMDAMGRSQQKPVLPIPTVAGYSRDSLQQGFSFEIR
jgi:hypothetical protein